MTGLVFFFLHFLFTCTYSSRYSSEPHGRHSRNRNLSLPLQLLIPLMTSLHLVVIHNQRDIENTSFQSRAIFLSSSKTTVLGEVVERLFSAVPVERSYLFHPNPCHIAAFLAKLLYNFPICFSTR